MKPDKIKLVKAIASIYKENIDLMIPDVHNVEIYYLDEKVKITRGVLGQTVILEMSFDELIEDFLSRSKGMK